MNICYDAIALVEAEIEKTLKDAVMEGTVNSVIHCDFEANGVLRIERQTEQIIMRNPGTLRISRDKIYQGEFTHARNQTMQRMFRMVGYGDNIGSGFQKILSAWASESWITPDLHEENEVHEVWMTLKLVSLFAPALLDRLHKLYGGSFDQCISEEKEILALIVGEYANTNAKLQQYTGKNSWEINRLLSGLTSQYFLISTPNGRWTTYEPNLEYISQINQQINLKDNNLKNNTKYQNQQINQRIETDQRLNDDQRRILMAMMAHSDFSMEALANEIGITTGTLRYQREKMKDYVNTLRVGSNKAGRWEIQFIEDDTDQ